MTMPRFLLSLMPISLLMWAGILLGNLLVVGAALLIALVCGVMWRDYDLKVNRQ